MSGTSEILAFGQGAGANVLNQADYTADAQRLTGHQPGVARAQLANKQSLQSSLMAAALAKFVADWQANNITDALTPATVADYLRVASQAAGAANLQGSNHSLNFGATPGFQKFPGGIILQWGPAILPVLANMFSSVMVTFPVAFPVACAVVVGVSTQQGNTSNYWPAINSTSWSTTQASINGCLLTPAIHFDVASICGYIALGY